MPTNRIKTRPYTKYSTTLPLPSDAQITKLCNLLIEQRDRNTKDAKYASVKQVLSLLGAGAALSAVVLVPNSALALAPMLKKHKDWDAWKHFNPSYLRRTLQRLEQQKLVDKKEENGQTVIKLTANGKRKILRYNLDHLEVVKPKSWDGKWRLVLYDVPIAQRALGELVRQTLQTIGFYPIQKSVYLYPYPCFDHIEFLREYYGLGNALQYMLITHIEHDDAYKTYFNLT